MKTELGEKPAFPLHGGEHNYPASGMTTRTFVAAILMAGSSDLVSEAVATADNLLAELEKD